MTNQQGVVAVGVHKRRTARLFALLAQIERLERRVLHKERELLTHVGGGHLADSHLGIFLGNDVRLVELHLNPWRITADDVEAVA